MVMLSACSVNPVLQAKKYEHAISGKNATSVIDMMENKAVSRARIQSAINKGEYGQLSRTNDWNGAETVSHLKMEKNSYLMVYKGNSWKIRCSTVGPYHDGNPEMTLLLFLHHIKNYNEMELRKLISNDLKLQEEEFSDEFKNKLLEFADEITPESCKAFEYISNNAYLAYSGHKTLSMVKEPDGWRILDLW